MTDQSRPDADAPFTAVTLETVKGRLCAVFSGSADPSVMGPFILPVDYLAVRLQKMQETGYRACLTQKALEMLGNCP